ncbi:hypothetical protein FPY71_00795 [Aureimonas fodinaquatilis]|uniref:Uncharacterized protein n=1 Tax=Aureimonas fodinaquatilis TaxID=2565783 RepID=A0A5B0E0Q8_9HYPH|nr:hypothetical protein [Aureimonas fodinaquatilis]KAA0971705.1 hypothetical protein FPY71_00795 [Aureimonas fodinaquatilis]
MKMTFLECIAVLAGAIVATFVTGLVAWLFAGVPLLTAIGSPGVYFLGLVTVAIFAFLYHQLDRLAAAMASLAVGVVLPTLVDRFILGDPLSWKAIFLLNIVFAVLALAIYRFVHANAVVRQGHR